ncbi:MAG: histidine phosphatase family protein [Pseudomonadota bacterium]
MRTLYLLRHAESPMSFAQKDSERALSDYGLQQAQQIANHLKDIDLALCSSATRTQKTLNTALDSGALVKETKMIDNLYNASMETILDEIRSASANNLLVVAHNPGIHLTAHSLAKSDQSPAYEKLSVSYPPCSLTILKCDIEDWALLDKHQNELVDYITA